MKAADLKHNFFELCKFNLLEAEETATAFEESDDKKSYGTHHDYYVEGMRKAHENNDMLMIRVWYVLEEAKCMATGFEQGIDTVSGSGVSARLQTAFKQLERLIAQNTGELNENNSSSAPGGAG